MEKLIRNVDLAATEVHATAESEPNFPRLLEKYHDAVWKIAGLIVALETDKIKKISVPRRLWFTMAFAPVKLFRYSWSIRFNTSANL
jgi:hypothetical protein